MKRNEPGIIPQVVQRLVILLHRTGVTLVADLKDPGLTGMESNPVFVEGLTGIRLTKTFP